MLTRVIFKWRASAIAQSGFKLEGDNFIIRYYRAVIQPPYRGVLATVLVIDNGITLDYIFYIDLLGYGMGEGCNILWK